MSDLQTLQQQIAALQQQLADLKAQSKVKKARPEKVVKPYNNGHYYQMVNPSDEVKAQIAKILGDDEVNSKLSKSQLGRAIIKHYTEKSEVIFWTPNKETLMFGPVMSGIKNAKEFETFTNVEISALIDLGHGFDTEKTGRVKVDEIVNFAEFVELEKAQAEFKKLSEKAAQIKK